MESKLIVYNKLVRDRIPEIIKSSGKSCKIRILHEDEYVRKLRKKAFEELEEYMSAKDDETAIEELADVLEIIHALAEYHGAPIEKVEKVRTQKAEKRRGFKEKIFLLEVEDE
jgi:predicted house-cleaning noncanonical NTP pyrophosphatase (MazG superfamily)